MSQQECPACGAVGTLNTTYHPDPSDPDDVIAEGHCENCDEVF